MPTEKDLILYTKLREKLGKGEAEAISMAKNRKLFFATNDKVASNALSHKLHAMAIKSYVLDGDNIRHGLNKDLGFSHEDRKENIRRIGEVSKLLIDAGLIVLTAFISPYKEDREQVRTLMKEGQFLEVYVKCSIEECEHRDPKGIYKKARSGQIKEFTGISVPYKNLNIRKLC